MFHLPVLSRFPIIQLYYLIPSYVISEHISVHRYLVLLPVPDLLLLKKEYRKDPILNLIFHLRLFDVKYFKLFRITYLFFIASISKLKSTVKTHSISLHQFHFNLLSLNANPKARILFPVQLYGTL